MITLDPWSGASGPRVDSSVCWVDCAVEESVSVRSSGMLSRGGARGLTTAYSFSLTSCGGKGLSGGYGVANS